MGLHKTSCHPHLTSLFEPAEACTNLLTPNHKTVRSTVLETHLDTKLLQSNSTFEHISTFPALNASIISWKTSLLAEPLLAPECNPKNRARSGFTSLFLHSCSEGVVAATMQAAQQYELLNLLLP